MSLLGGGGSFFDDLLVDLEAADPFLLSSTVIDPYFRESLSRAPPTDGVLFAECDEVNVETDRCGGL